MNTLFDGSYKRKPLVALGGRVKTEEKDTLLQRVKMERESREAQKTRIVAATCLQSAYRGYRTRQQIKQHLRQMFQESSSQLNSSPLEVFYQQTYIFLRFYNFREDSNQLIVLCQKWLSRRRDILSSPTIQSHVYLIQQLLGHCCYFLPRAGQQSIAIPIRMLEVFLTPESYTAVSSEGVTPVGKILQYVVDKGYFSSLRVLLETYTPPPDTPTLIAPTPLADSLVKLMVTPLVSYQTDERIMRSFVEDVVSVHSTCTHFDHLVVPALKNRLNPSTFVAALVQRSHDRRVTLTFSTSFQTLHFFLTISEDKLVHMSAPELALYLSFIAEVLRDQTPHTFPGAADGSDDEDEVAPIATKGLFGKTVLRPQHMYVVCMEYINSGVIPQSLKSVQWSEELLDSLCSLCYQLISSHSIVPHASRLFRFLSLNHGLITLLWRSLQQMTVKEAGGEVSTLFTRLKRSYFPPNASSVRFVPQLTVFCTLYSLALLSIHDGEFFSEEVEGRETVSAGMFSHGELMEMCAQLRDSAVGLTLLVNQRKSSAMLWGVLKGEESEVSLSEWDVLLSHVCKLLRYLHERDTRRQFCPKNHWRSPLIKYRVYELPEQLFIEDEDEDSAKFSTPSSVKPFFQLLKQIPFVFDFSDRVVLFRKLIGRSLSTHQPLRGFMMGPSIKLEIKRESIYEDAFTQLVVDQDLRRPVYVQFTNLEGVGEAGIDGGGLFREFLTELLRIGFDPNRGFFKVSHEGLLYPNPQIRLITSDHALHYRFLGRMLGKAMFENLLVELPLAGFFLKKFISRAGGKVDINHLSSLDPELYKNLLFLKHHPSISELSLNFTVVNNDFGEAQVIELKENGHNINVTATNREEFIHRMADYRLNKQMGPLCHSFIQGLGSVIPLEWLQMFNEREIQVLVSGAQVPINIEDLKLHTTYSGVFNNEHESIDHFWKVVSSFSEDEKNKLLKFVTSCSRPPLLGFKELYPKFNIHSAGEDDERLPTASTCMNMLKLPVYSSADVLRNRLLYAIKSNAGFELS